MGVMKWAAKITTDGYMVILSRYIIYSGAGVDWKWEFRPKLPRGASPTTSGIETIGHQERVLRSKGEVWLRLID
jgi:hypothetical protein